MMVAMENDLAELITVLSGVGILIGVIGTIVPVLPGVLLCWLSVLAWALLAANGTSRWIVLAVATLLALAGAIVQYTWPGKRLKQAGVPNRTLILGGLLALVGFFVIPLFGLIIGFVLGVWLAEQARLHDRAAAWAATKHALKAAGLSMLIELAAALGIAATWIIGLLTT